MISLEEEQSDNENNNNNFYSSSNKKSKENKSFLGKIFNSFSKIGQGLRNIMSIKLENNYEDQNIQKYICVSSPNKPRKNPIKEINEMNINSQDNMDITNSFNQSNYFNPNNNNRIYDFSINKNNYSYINNNSGNVENNIVFNINMKNNKIKSNLLIY